MDYRILTLRLRGLDDRRLEIAAQSTEGDARETAPTALPRSQLAGAGRWLAHEVLRRRDTSASTGLTSVDATSREAIREDRSGGDFVDPETLGCELFASLFPPVVRRQLDSNLGARSDGEGLRLQISLDLADGASNWLAALPWELLCRRESGRTDFLALDRRFSPVRYLEIPTKASTRGAKLPLRVLAVRSAPRGAPPLDLNLEWRGLVEGLCGVHQVELAELERPTRNRLAERLRMVPYDVVHFMGHGAFDETRNEGALCLETESGGIDSISGPLLGRLLRGATAPALFVLNVCQSGRTAWIGEPNPAAGVAAGLLEAGIPSVLAMQFPISDPAAIELGVALIRSLALGSTVDEAVADSRQAVHQAFPNTFEWATPVLFSRVPPQRLVGDTASEQAQRRDRAVTRLRVKTDLIEAENTIIEGTSIDGPSAEESLEDVDMNVEAGTIRGRKSVTICGRQRTVK